MTLSQRTGVAEINTHWSFRFPLLVRIPIRKASFPKQSGTGMPSLIRSSPLPNCRMIVYLNSLPLLELVTNLPRPSLFLLTGDRRQTKQFCFLDADCLVVGESQSNSRRSAGRYPVKPPRPEGDSQTIDTLQCRNS